MHAYDYVRKMGWPKTLDFDKYYAAKPVFESPPPSIADLRENQNQAYQRLYLRPTYILHILSRGGIYGFSATRTALAHLRRVIKSELKARYLLKGIR